MLGERFAAAGRGHGRFDGAWRLRSGAAYDDWRDRLRLRRGHGQLFMDLGQLMGQTREAVHCSVGSGCRKGSAGTHGEGTLGFTDCQREHAGICILRFTQLFG